MKIRKGNPHLRQYGQSHCRLRTAHHVPSRFDPYVEAVINGDNEAMEATLTPDEVAGLRLFIWQGQLTQCHNGPLLTDNHFHNTGVPAAAVICPRTLGRALGAQQVLADEFNCLGPYSDAAPDECTELRFMVAEGHELERQFKAPSLRNVAERATLYARRSVRLARGGAGALQQRTQVPAGHSELEPLDLSNKEIEQLIAFVRTLSAWAATHSIKRGGSNGESVVPVGMNRWMTVSQRFAALLIVSIVLHFVFDLPETRHQTTQIPIGWCLFSLR